MESGFTFAFLIIIGREVDGLLSRPRRDRGQGVLILVGPGGDQDKLCRPGAVRALGERLEDQEAVRSDVEGVIAESLAKRGHRAVFLFQGIGAQARLHDGNLLFG
jgi:hypothetical protein